MDTSKQAGVGKIFDWFKKNLKSSGQIVQPFPPGKFLNIFAKN